MTNLNASGRNSAFAQPRFTNLVPMFISDLDSESQELKRNAAQALGRIGDIRAVEPLLALLEKSEVPAVQKAAVKALGKLGSPKVLPKLRQMLTHSDPHPFFPIERTLTKAIKRLERQLPPPTPPQTPPMN